MATWTLDRPVEVNAEGNVITLGFKVQGLAFTPVHRRSSINARDGSFSRVGPIVGWRSNIDTGGLFFRAIDSNDPLAAAMIISRLERIGITDDWLVDVAVRFTDTQFIAINAGAEKVPTGTTNLFVQKIGAGLITLRPASGSAMEPSTAFLFTNGTGNQSIRVAAEKIGRLPGWDSGTPHLSVHGDAQAERVRRTGADSSSAAISLPEWENLIGAATPPTFTGEPGSRPDVRSKGTGGNPYIRYVEDGVSTDQTRLTLDAAAAGLNIGSGNVTFGAVAWTSQTTLAHLVGRWSGSANSNRQWRIVYDPTSSPKVVRIDFARNSSVTSISTPLAGDLSARTLVMYRASTGIDAAWEVWINGVLVNSGSPIPLSGNTGANKRLTIGARATDNNDPPTSWTDFLNTSGSATPTTEVPGSVDQVAIYTQRLSDGALNLAFHEMARRAGIEFDKPIIQPNPATQAYGPDNPVPERRLDRKPVALINLFGGVGYDFDPLGRIEDWYLANTAWLKEQVHRCLNGCDDYEILFNRPAGTYAGDIIASGIFGDLRGSPGTPCISTAQWTAMKDTWDEFGLSDHNARGLGVAPPDELRRGWFYTGGGMSLDDDGNVTQNAGCNARKIAPLTPEFYRTSVLDYWIGVDDRFRCLMLDSAIKFDGRFVTMVHDAAIREDFTLVGEAISTDQAARLRAPWVSACGFSGAPWWNNNRKNDGYNSQWTSDWNTKPIYFGVLQNEELDLTNTTGGDGNAVRGDDNLRFGDIYTFVRKGATPMAWGGQYAKVGAAWDYGADRIPVGRFTMLSPRNARVWR